MKIVQSKLQIFTLITVILWSCHSEAQRQGVENVSPEKIAQKQTELQTEKLGLNKEQADKLKVINLKYAEQMQTEMKQRLKDRKESIAQMKEINQSQNQDVKAILSDEQFKNYIKLKKQSRAKMRARVSERRDKNQELLRDRMASLDLSEEQKVQLKATKTKYGKKVKEVKQRGRSKENGQEIMNLMNAMDEEVKEILSEKQFEEYMKIKAEQFEKRKAKMQRVKR